MYSSHRCRSRQILGGAKDFCQNSPKLARKPTKKWPPNNSACDFGRHFFQIKAGWAPLLLIYSGSLLRFSWILWRFSEILTKIPRIFKNFAWIFTKSKLLGVQAHLPRTAASYTSDSSLHTLLRNSHLFVKMFVNTEPEDVKEVLDREVMA